MPLDHRALASWTFEEQIHRYGTKDTILYALGLGCGEDPEDLPFVYEKGLRALPSMAAILGDPGFWLQDPRLGADWAKAVHGEQSITLHAPLPPAGTLVARNAIEEVIDKGPGRGVLVVVARTLSAEGSDQPVATLRMLIVLRGDGGSGGADRPTPKPVEMPDRPPDLICSKKTLPQAALIYRLSGDFNPLHADPAAAAKAGFDTPILHGLCTMGVAARSILKSCCGDDPARLKSVSVRFSAPVFPGETIRTEIWRDGPQILFQCSVEERRVVVLRSCRAMVAV